MNKPYIHSYLIIFNEPDTPVGMFHQSVGYISHILRGRDYRKNLDKEDPFKTYLEFNWTIFKSVTFKVDKSNFIPPISPQMILISCAILG